MTTGPDFAEEHVLGDGTRVRFRHIRPEDARELRYGFEHLSPESRYHRFNGFVRELTEAQVRYFTEVDGIDHVALVAVPVVDDGAPAHGLGVARFVRDPARRDMAEMAITIADEAQHKGLGTLLLRTLARAARERGVHHFDGQFGADNGAMRALLRDVGAAIDGPIGTDALFDVNLDA